MSGLPTWVQELRLKAELPELDITPDEHRQSGQTYVYKAQLLCRERQYRALSETVLKLIDLLESRPAPAGMGEWIPVSERMPDAIDDYLVEIADNNGGRFMDVRTFHGRSFRVSIGYRATHWMPLPAPPESKGEPR